MTAEHRMMRNAVQWIMTPLAVLYFAFFLSKADTFLFYHGMLDTRPIIIFAAGAAPIALYAIARKNVLETLRDVRSVAAPLCACIGVALFVEISVPTRTTDLRITHEVVVAGGLFGLGVVSATVEWVRNGWRAATGLALATTCATIVWDCFFPGSFSLFSERSAGFAENPNMGALTAVLLLASFLRWRHGATSLGDVIALVATGLAVLLTQSRGGMLVYTFAVGAYVFSRPWRKRRVKQFSMALIAIVPAVLFTVGAGMSDSTTWLADLSVFRSEILFDESAQERADVLANATALIDDRVLSGWGNGHVLSMRVGPHNMYLARWVDNGLLGFAAYCWWMSALVWVNWRHRSREGLVLALILVGYGLLSHNLLEDRTLLIVVGFATSKAVLEHGTVVQSPPPDVLSSVNATVTC